MRETDPRLRAEAVVEREVSRHSCSLEGGGAAGRREINSSARRVCDAHRRRVEPTANMRAAVCTEGAKRLRR